jgi:hypothetical protein
MVQPDSKLTLIERSFTHRSAAGLLLAAVIAIIAIPCWRFVFRGTRYLRDVPSN